MYAMIARLLFAAVALWFLALPSQAERRVALVIGNSAYAHIGALSNPLNDARALTAQLERFGFDVTMQTDLDVESFDRIFAAFTDKAKGADVALFYFAGHGQGFDNENYLIPVDAKLNTDLSLKREAVNVKDIADRLGRAAKMSLFFLDACRNNPRIDALRERLTENGHTREAGSLVRGFARIPKAAGQSLIVYAAAPGTVAFDGEGENSPFTGALIASVREAPHLEIESLLKRVRRSVIDATKEAARSSGMPVQEPEWLSRLNSDFKFSNKPPTPSIVALWQQAKPFVESDRQDILKTRQRITEDKHEISDKLALIEKRLAPFRDAPEAREIRDDIQPILDWLAREREAADLPDASLAQENLSLTRKVAELEDLISSLKQSDEGRSANLTQLRRELAAARQRVDDTVARSKRDRDELTGRIRDLNTQLDAARRAHRDELAALEKRLKARPSQVFQVVKQPDPGPPPRPSPISRCASGSSGSLCISSTFENGVALCGPRHFNTWCVASATQLPPNKQARALQFMLQKLGYLSGSIDGKVGPGTRSSLRRFYEANTGFRQKVPFVNLDAPLSRPDIVTNLVLFHDKAHLYSNDGVTADW